MSHQVVTAEDYSQTTIVRAGKYTAGKTPVHEAIIKLPDAEAALQYQKNMINTELGAYHALENSCLSHVCDVLEAGGNAKIGRSDFGYGKFMKRKGFGRLR